MKNLIKSIVSDKVRGKLRNRLCCSVCNQQAKHFLPFGIAVERNNAQCPNCLSLERHRLQALWMNKNMDMNADMKVFHTAPEHCYSNKFRNSPNIDYYPIDLYPKFDFIQKMDLLDVKYDDNMFDLVISNHVLEHIVDDGKAISELCRITKKEGLAIISVPILQEKTYEDASIVTPEDRLRVFLQEDHVRICGVDYKERLIEGGYKKVEFIQQLLPKSDMCFYGIPTDTLAHGFFVCRKD